MIQDFTITTDARKLCAISSEIHDSYFGDLKNETLLQFKSICCTSSKNGFPIICTFDDEKEQYLWASKLLLLVTRTWPLDNMPHRFSLLKGSHLHYDATQLITAAVGNKHQLLISSK